MNNPNPDPDTANTTTYGRVVYLHFSCRAALPIGSSLRVTSSQLWAPGTLRPTDPSDANNVSVQASELALPDNTVDGALDVDGHDGAFAPHVHLSYASSVEMVTSPEEWPLWRTRTPVVISLRHHHGQVEQHHYRYLVVTPGADDDTMDMDEEQNEYDNTDDNNNSISNDDDEEMKVQGSGLGATTSQNGTNVAAEVMAWEDPFCETSWSRSDLQMSTGSFPSVRRQALSKTLANLPYRTVEIDVNTAQVRYNRCYSKRNSITEDDTNNDQQKEEDISNLEYTEDGVLIDSWNEANDYTFCPYVLRNELNKQNKAKKIMISRLNNNSTATVASGNNLIYPNDIGHGGSGQDDGDGVGSIGNIRTRVSFNHLIEVVQHDEDDVMDSAYTSLTMTPKMPVSALSKTSTKRKGQIYFVCFHLPVILTKDVHTMEWNACWSESLLAATDGSMIVRDYDCHWIGTISLDIRSEEEKNEIREVLAKMNCTPLFFDKKIKDDHYFGMCKQVLWPAFHNIDLLDLSGSVVADDCGDPVHLETQYRSSCSDWDQSRLDGWWQAFVSINTTFAETLSNMLQPGDIMWVHDYHLSLLPKLVNDKEIVKYDGNSVTKKVFLLHIPFPTSQVFRELECGEAILEGMLHADVVGFHAFDHARHFLKAAKRILGLNYESLIGGLIGVQHGRRTILVTMHNVSIEPSMVNAALEMTSVNEATTMLRHNHASRTVIASIDIAQRLSGISLKLLAFERLLTDYPVWQQQVVLIQKCLLPGSRLDDEARTIQEIRYLVKRIKQKFGPNVIDCQEFSGSTFPIHQRLALWKVADVLMTTPIREGLNLIPLEYVYTKKKPAAPGVVISSEFSAVCNVLNGALRVNPFDVQMTVTSIDKALTMTEDEKEARRIRDESFVSSCTSSKWTNLVLDDLHDATAVTDGASDNDSDDTSIMGTKYDNKNLIASTAAYLAQECEIGFSHLDMSAVANAYKSSKKRVLILDLNGTIVFKEPAGKYLKRDVLGSSGMIVEKEVSDALAVLCSDPYTAVFVVSGDSQENVEKAIGNVRGLGLAASNGACFAPPLRTGEWKRTWKFFDLGVNWEEVKKITMPIVAKYTARSNGSFIKLTHSSIGWSYYSCDPEWGSLQASHLVLELDQALRAFDVRFVMIKGIVEVVPRILNKGLIVKNVLREVQSTGDDDVDFILCMGDDIQDEKMFTSVFSFLAELHDPEHTSHSPPVIDHNGSTAIPNVSMSEESHHKISISFSNDVSKNRSKSPIHAYTTTIGKKDSHAFTYVDDARDVATLLKKLANFDIS